jgi:glycosyltransferase involved in cell wall biosynthesis
MRILVISQYFPPDITAAAFRIGDAVEYFHRNENEIRVITAHPHKAIVNSKSSENEFLKNVFIYRSKTISIGQGGLWRYLFHYFSFVVGCLFSGITLYLKKWRPEIIWATSPPLFTGISAFLLSKIFKCPFVFDIRDIWPESAVSAGQISTSGKAFQFGKFLEVKLYDVAAHLTCVSNAMADYLRKMTSTPVTAVHNGVRPVDHLKQRQFFPQKTIMYAGNFGRVQGLEVLIRGFADLQNTDQLNDWKVVLIGTGAHEIKLKKLISDLYLEKRVDVLSPMTRNRALQEMVSAGILFMNLMPDKIFELTIPSKVFDYMLAGRPILAGIAGEGKEILKMTGGNLCFEQNNIESFKTALMTVASKLSYFEKGARQNIDFVLTNFMREKGLIKLNAVFDESLNNISRKQG